MIRFSTALAAAGISLALCGPAHSGDIASVQPLGFSEDGSVFAFEQYGVQDGSGFPYSDIFVIDTDKDTFLPGSPIRVRIDDETVGLGQARAKAMAQASEILKDYDIEDHPGKLVAFNPVSELDTDAYFIRYLPYPADPAFGNPYAFSLEESSHLPADQCEGILDEVKGFRLILKQKDGKDTNTIVHEDTTVPKSRNCPTGYRIGGVVTYTAMDGATVHVVLINVLSHGFEGHDGRWIAVPVHP